MKNCARIRPPRSRILRRSHCLDLAEPFNELYVCCLKRTTGSSPLLSFSRSVLAQVVPQASTCPCSSSLHRCLSPRESPTRSYSTHPQSCSSCALATVPDTLEDCKPRAGASHPQSHSPQHSAASQNDESANHHSLACPHWRPLVFPFQELLIILNSE